MSKPTPDPTPAEALRDDLGRALGFATAAFLLLLGGGIAVILVAALFFRFLSGA